jgi:RNA polymerase sigma-70 factor, ECF subfamily
VDIVADSEEDVISQAKAGSAEAFGRLVQLYEGRIRSFLAASLGTPALADDLSQDAFITAFRRLETYDASLPFYPWLKGIALNLLRNHLRRRRPEPLEEWKTPLAMEYVDRFPDDDALHALRRCLGKLDDDARRLVKARYLDGMALEKVAERERRDPHALSMALVRIRERLRRCMEGS